MPLLPSASWSALVASSLSLCALFVSRDAGSQDFVDALDAEYAFGLARLTTDATAAAVAAVASPPMPHRCGPPARPPQPMAAAAAARSTL